MNTKPKKKRYQKAEKGTQAAGLSNLYAGIHDIEVAKSFSLCLTQFEDLLNYVPSLLAVLLGGSDTTVASCVMRAINGVPTDILKTLLEEAEVNESLPEEFDAVIRDLKTCAEIRNRLAHAKWYTHDPGDGSPLKVFLSVIEDRKKGEPWRNNREITAEQNRSDAEKMTDLSLRILRLTGPILKERRTKATHA